MKAAYHLAVAFGVRLRMRRGLGARAAQPEKGKLGRHGLAETSESSLSGQEGAARHADGLAARSDERRLTHEQHVFVDCPVCIIQPTVQPRERNAQARPLERDEVLLARLPHLLGSIGQHAEDITCRLERRSLLAFEAARLPSWRVLLHHVVYVSRAREQASGSLAENRGLLRLHGAELAVQRAEAREHRLYMGAYGCRLEVGRSLHWAHEVVAGLHARPHFR